MGYARSHLNPPGPLSRMCKQCGEDAIPLEEGLISIPNLLVEIFPSFETLESARFDLPGHAPGPSEGWKRGNYEQAHPAPMRRIAS